MQSIAPSISLTFTKYVLLLISGLIKIDTISINPLKKGILNGGKAITP